MSGRAVSASGGERRRPCGVGFVSAPAMPFSAKRLATDGMPSRRLECFTAHMHVLQDAAAARVAISTMCGSSHESGGEPRCAGGGLTAARAWLQRPVSPAAATLKAENLAMLSRSTMRAITVGGSPPGAAGTSRPFQARLSPAVWRSVAHSTNAAAAPRRDGPHQAWPRGRRLGCGAHSASCLP